ncbi:MAG: sugar ABC transporter ATP-binding protein [Planctomycetes bacterium]|nr:sugar ABC transporter ATP-binding protein [Planctomycetota bacterium]
MGGELYLQMRGIEKAFHSVYALKGVDLAVRRGEVHALLGENGAGKSTLIKILNGIYQADGGEIYIQGELKNISCVGDAQQLGISVIHQELCLAENIPVYENIFMGRENDNKSSLFADKKMMAAKAGELLKMLQAGFTATDIVGDLSIANKQMVEIARALSIGTNIIVMDEPTSSLTPKEVKSLFDIIRRLSAQGISIIYISHRLEELFAIADKVTVLRDGQYIATLDMKDASEEKLISLMVGRKLDEFYHKESNVGDAIVLSVRDLTRKNVVEGVSFDLREGEILGFSGLVGAGRTEIARLIFGADKADSGEIVMAGEPRRIETPLDAMRNGIMLVPEDRKKDGLFLEHSVGFNITIGFLERFFKRVIGYDKMRERRLIQQSIDDLAVKASSSQQEVQFLSGGNQQKVVLAKALGTEPKVLILDEPTRGIDVGAKSEIYLIMRQLTKAGIAIILISSDLPEIVNLSDRVVVVAEGRIAATLAGGDISQENIMFYATGGKANVVA